MDHSYSMGGLIPLLILGAPLLAALFALATAPKRDSRRVHREAHVPLTPRYPLPGTALNTERM